MTEAPTNARTPRKVSLNVRPLRFAYFLLEDDWAGLERILRFTCTQWGGIRNFLIPVSKDLEFWDSFEQMLTIHPPDRFISYLPADVDATPLTRRLQTLFPGHHVMLLPGPTWEQRDRSAHALSVLSFAPQAAEPLPAGERKSLNVFAIPEDSSERAFLLALFGAIYQNQEEEYQKIFHLRPVSVGLRDDSLWQRQHDQTGNGSVLNVTSYELCTHEIRSPGEDLAFHLIVADSVVGICYFWNYRAVKEAAAIASTAGRRTLLVPDGVIADPRTLQSLCEYLRTVPTVPETTSDLDLVLTCMNDETGRALEEQLRALSGVEVPQTARLGVERWFGYPDRSPREADPNRVLRCGFARPPICDSYLEGYGRRQLPTMAFLDLGRNDILFEPPQKFRNRWRGHTVVDIGCDAWKDYARDAGVANLVQQGAWFTRYGLSVELETPERPTYLQVTVPSVWEAVRTYFSQRGFGIRVSTPGKYAAGLLDLVGGLKKADLFASTLAYRVLDALAMKSSKKVAQRIMRELKADPSAEEGLLRLLRDADIVPELKKSPKTLQELLGLGERSALLSLLGGFAQAKVVKRGFHASCPACMTPSWFPLSSVHETLTCPGCSHVFPLPVQYPHGSGLELTWEYTLNSLVNRAMDQDVLPAILALFHETKPDCRCFAVPGLELIPLGSNDVEGELDVFFIRDQELFAGECKAGTELADKDFQTARFAASLGVREFSFSTVRRFSEETMQRVEQLRTELQQQRLPMTVKVLTGGELLGGAIP